MSADVEAQTGTITGTVTAEVGGAPINGAWVQVSDSQDSFITGVNANAAGVFTLSVPAGTYFVRTYAGQGYIDEVYNNISCGGGCQPSSGTPVVVTSGGTAAGIDFALAIGGRISGIVTSSSAAPLANIEVEVRDATGRWLANGVTDALGQYTTYHGVPSGSYYVTTNNRSGYVNEVYPDVACVVICSSVSGGTTVSVTAGSTTSGIDFSLAQGGTISGSITAAVGGAAITRNTSVNVYSASGAYLGSRGIDSLGQYTLSLAPGTYYIGTYNSEGYISEVYPNISCGLGCTDATRTLGTAFNVIAGSSATNIDFALDLGATVTGTVTTSLGVPIPNIMVVVQTTNGTWVSNGTTDSQGVYRTREGIGTGSFNIITAGSTGYVNERYPNVTCYGNCTSTPTAYFNLMQGETRTGVDFDLSQGGMVGGTLTHSVTGVAIPFGAWVDVFNASGFYLGGGSQDSLGRYSITLPAGTYRLATNNNQGLINRVYNGVECTLGCNIVSGTTVAVTTGGTMSNIDFALAAGARIGGTVSGIAGAPIANLRLDFYRATGQWAGVATTNQQGQYLSDQGFGTGTLYARTVGAPALGYIDEIYGGIACPGSNHTNQLSGTCGPITAGTPINLTAGVPSTGIDFALDVDGNITGTVTDASGAPINAVTVTAFSNTGSFVASASTNALGVYSLNGLTPATYYLRTDNTSGYINELYDNTVCIVSCSVTSGTGVAVSSGQTTTGINFALDLGGRISGRVTDMSAVGLSGITVGLWTPNGVQATSIQTDANGNYTTGPGLPPGAYYARTSVPSGSLYLNEIYDNVPCVGSLCAVTQGTPITLTAGTVVSNIDFALLVGGQVTGTVRSGVTPLPGVTVSLRGLGGHTVSVVTNGAGQYTASGLYTDAYHAATSNSGQYIEELHNGRQCFAPCAPSGPSFSVIAGSTTSGIDFDLALGGRISGRVTDAAGNPLQNVSIIVRTATNQGVPGANLAGISSGTTNATNSNGDFFTTTGLPPGSYYLATAAPASLGVVDELYDNAPCPGGSVLSSIGCGFTGGTPVVITGITTVTGINFVLTPGGRISGRVLDSSGAPIANALLNVNDTGGRFVASASTNATGVYTTGAVIPSGTYFVRIVSSSLSVINELYNDIPCEGTNCGNVTAGTPVNVTPPATTTDIDFSLSTGGRVSGTVSDAVTGQPLIGVSVGIVTRSGQLVASATSGAGGAFLTVSSIPSGTYYARTSQQLGYLDEYYQDVPCVGSCFQQQVSGTPISVVAGSTTPDINIALNRGGRIGGTVVADGSNAPLVGVGVVIFDATGRQVAGAITSITGQYQTTPLLAGTYFARTADSQGYINEAYDNVVCLLCPPSSLGSPIVVTANNTTTANFSLATGALFSGTVTTTTNAPINGVTVSFYAAGISGAVASATTDALGRYTTSIGVPSGTYYARTFNSEGYIDEVHATPNDLECLFCQAIIGSGIVATAGATVTNIDFALSPAGRINGLVTSGGTPVSNVTVYIFNGAGTQVATATTTYLGTYGTTVGLLTGEYFARTRNSTGLIDERHDGQVCLTCNVLEAAPIVVTAGSATNNVNFDLAVGGRISGQVSRADGTGLGSVTVEIYSADDSFITSALTNSSGQYVTAVGLPPGTYYARTSNTQGYADEIFDNASCPGCDANTGTPITVAAGATTSNINFTLDVGGRISGRVTDALTGLPLANVTVEFYSSDEDEVASVRTDGAGNYTSPGLPAGTYYVATDNALGYINEAYDNVPCPGCSTQSATPVIVTLGVTTANINFALTAGGGISGRVTSASIGVANVSVIIANAAGEAIATVTTTNTGTYTVPGLIAGTYFARTFNTLGYLDEVYDDSVCGSLTCVSTRGTPIIVSAGAVTADRNFDLVAGGRIAGVVTGPAGTGLENVTVSIYNAARALFAEATTNSLGQYSTPGRLPSGTYFAVTSNSLGLLNEVYSDIACGGFCQASSGVPITVTAGATTNGIDFVLVAGGRVAGTIRAAVTNEPLANVVVEIFSIAGTKVATATSNLAGEYLTPASLSAGRYFASTVNTLGLMNGRSAEFSVAASATTSGIDMTLSAGGRVSGRVTSSTTGLPIPGVAVQIHDRTNFLVTTAISGADGHYVTHQGLPAGAYFARTLNDSGFVDERYNNASCAACLPNEGTVITVTTGSVTTGIDFALDRGGSIRGVITDASTGAPLSNVDVGAFNAAGDLVRGTTSDDTGSYEISGLPTGTFYARTRNERGYADEVYNDTACSYREVCSVAAGTAIEVTAGAITTAIDFALLSAGRITGRVTDSSSGAVPIAEAEVTVYDINGRQVAQVETDGAGRYSTTGLPAGTYFAHAVADSYIREIYADATCFPRCVVTDGTAIVLDGSNVAANVNFSLPQGGRISGVITDGDIPLPGVKVEVYSLDKKVFISNAATDASGRYVTAEGLLAGQYYVRTLNQVGRIDELFGDVVCLADVIDCAGGTPVSVSAGQETTAINFTLALGGKIGGGVSDDASTEKLPDVDIIVFDPNGKKVSETKTDSQGKYESKNGLPAGDYHTSTKNKIDYADKANGDIVCVLAQCDVTRSPPVKIEGTGSTGVDFRLRRGGRISGRVTGRRGTTVAPLPGVRVEIYNATGQLLASVTTGAGGRYTTEGGLPTGDYFLKTHNDMGFTDRLYNNRPCEACRVTDGAPVAVAAGSTTSGIDFDLVRGALISGTIFDKNTGVPIKNAPVLIKKVVGSSFETVGRSRTDDNGVYAGSVTPGTYYIQSDALPGYQTKIYKLPNPGPLRGQIWPSCPRGLCDPDLGSPIDVAFGTYVGRIDLGLDSCGSLSLNPARLQLGSVGTPYSQTLTASGGTAPYAFRVTDGELPPGLALNGDTGVISGSTPAAGSTSFAISALDANGCSATRTFNPTICSIDLTASSLAVSAAAGSGTLGIITAAGDCQWTASDDASWLTLSSTSGTGSSTVTYTYEARGPFAQPRVATISVGTQTFRLTQTGDSPTFSVTPSNVTVLPAAGNVTLGVSSNLTDATWTVATNVPWIVPVTTGGTGSGQIILSVARNTTIAARTGTVMAGGQSATIVQLPNGIPGQPVDLWARVTGGRARFSWSPPIEGGDATSYALEAGLAPTQTALVFDTTDASTSYELPPSVPNGQFYFRVKARNEFGVSVASAEYQLTVVGGTNPPGPPQNVSYTLVNGVLNMSWVAPATGGAATGYLLEAGSASGLANIATIPLATTTFSFTGVPPGNFFVRIRATNTAGPGAPSAEVLLNAGGVPSPPGAPRNATATAAAGGAVTIAWQAPADGGAPASYVLEAGSARGQADIATFNTGGTATSISFTGVPPGVYYLRLRAQNAQGVGIVSNEVRLVVP